VARVAGAVLLTRAGLTLLGYGRMRRLIAQFGRPPGSTPEPSPDEVDRVTWAARAVGQRVLGDKPCLTEAMVAQLLLSRMGLAAKLQIGVRRGRQGELEAHAWIEHRGRILIGDCAGLERFSRLPPLGLTEHDRQPEAIQ